MRFMKLLKTPAQNNEQKIFKFVLFILLPLMTMLTIVSFTSITATKTEVAKKTIHTQPHFQLKFLRELFRQQMRKLFLTRSWVQEQQAWPV